MAVGGSQSEVGMSDALYRYPLLVGEEPWELTQVHNIAHKKGRVANPPWQTMTNEMTSACAR